jgi:hypothetical protein
MFGGDEIVFTGAYKDFKLGVKYDVSGKSEKDVSASLVDISAAIEPHAFALSGIDIKAIGRFVSFSGKGLGGVCDYLNNSSSEWNKWAKENIAKKELMPIAESYLFNLLLRKAGVSFKSAGNSPVKPQSEEIGDVIAFIGRYGKWVAIKKLGLDKVRDYEVSGILSGINYTAVNKGFDFSGTGREDDKVNAIAKGKRKSLGNALSCLEEVKSEGESPYLVCKVLETVGYRPYASSHMLTSAYPDIKPPKVKGRKPKG